MVKALIHLGSSPTALSGSEVSNYSIIKRYFNTFALIYSLNVSLFITLVVKAI